MSCAFFEVHAAPERRGSDYCGNKWRARRPKAFCGAVKTALNEKSLVAA